MEQQLIILFSLVFFIMFIYSGIDKIINYKKKVQSLKEKINVSDILLNTGMICVILLEVFAPLIIITRLFIGEKSPKTLKLLSNVMFGLLILFMIAVTLIYHPPSANKLIPFLSNCTTFAGIIFLFILSNSELINKKI